MTDINCNDAVAALLRAIENGDTLDPAIRAHLQSCASCGKLVDGARRIGEELSHGPSDGRTADVADVSIAETVSAAETTVTHDRKTRLIRRLAGVVIGFGAVALCVAYFMHRAGLPLEQSAAIVAAGLVIALFIAAPLLVLIHVILNARTPQGKRLYRRLGPGKWIDGVCLGIADAMGWSVTMVRLVFVLAIWLKGLGVVAYFLFGALTPVHPDDRRYMLRFKVKRAWESLRARS